MGSDDFHVAEAYGIARERYASYGVDTEQAIETMDRVIVSMNCWQADDVTGFEGAADLSGGIMATGNYPGRARTGDELRSDAETAFGLIPGKHRLNLQAKPD